MLYVRLGGGGRLCYLTCDCTATLAARLCDLGMIRVFVVWDSKTRDLRTTLESLSKYWPDGMEVHILGLSPNAGEIHADLVVREIQRADRVLAVLSRPNANVGFEIGVAYGLGKEIALAILGPKLPDWADRPPLANFLVLPFTGVQDLRDALPQKIWHRRREEESQPAGGDDPTLFLCPRTGSAQAYQVEREQMKLPYRTLPEHSTFNLTDLPEQTAGVQQLVWTVSSFAEGTDDRDGEENAANAVVAGWFYAQQLRSMGESTGEGEVLRLSAAQRAALRERFWVLRSSEARLVADVQPFERAFDSLSQYAELLRQVPVIASSSPPNSAESAGSVAIATLQTFLQQQLTMGELVELARGVGGEDLARAVETCSDKATRAARLAEFICTEEACCDPRVLKGIGEFIHNGDALVVALCGGTSGIATGRSTNTAATLSMGVRPTMGAVLGAAARLDRTHQWGQLSEEIGEDRDSLVLLHGDSRQSLGLFLQRLFQHSALLHSDIARVGFSHERVRAQTGADWELRLQAALAAYEGQPASATALLALRAKDAPLYIVLGRQPLFQLTVSQRAGLQEFLETTYPRCLAAAAPANPVRLFVPLEAEAEDTWVSEVREWAAAGEANFRAVVRGRGPGTRLLHCVPLRQVRFPDWDDVEEYLDQLPHPRPTREMRERIRSEYQRIAADPRLNFRTLTDMLDKHLELD